MIAARELVEVEASSAMPSKSSGTIDRASRRRCRPRAAKFGQAGVGTITSSPVPAIAVMAIWIACMPPPVTKKRSGEKSRPNWRVVIAGERGAQLGDAALLGVEGLAGRERAVGRVAQMKSGVGRSPSPAQSGISPARPRP